MLEGKHDEVASPLEGRLKVISAEPFRNDHFDPSISRVGIRPLLPRHSGMKLGKGQTFMATVWVDL